MSAENEKVCCNCRHNIRSKDKKYDMIVCQCDVYNIYLNYAEVMTSSCRRWSEDLTHQKYGRLEVVSVQCEKWTNNNDKFEEWLRQEAENE